MQAQTKSMDLTWFSAYGREGRIKIVGTKKRLSNGKELNRLVALDVAKALKMYKKSKATATDDSNSYNESEYLNIK